MSTLERERRFLVARLPGNLEACAAKNIKQGYLLGDGLATLRVRSSLIVRAAGGTPATGSCEFCLTYKHGDGATRCEVEPAISAADFDALWPLTAGKRISKTRHYVPLDGESGGLTAELDRFDGDLDGHWQVEVEFASPDEMSAFVPPPWFGREVTDDGRYTNAGLAHDGLPPDARPFPLAEGVERVIAATATLLAGGPRIVLVAGGSATGKTSQVADKLAAAFAGSVTIPMDDYMRGERYITQQLERGRRVVWDDPEYYDLQLLAGHLAELRAGRAVLRPTYDFKTGERGEAVRQEPGRLIIVEGIHAAHDLIAGMGDLTVYVGTSLHGRLVRRLLRDRQRTSLTTGETLRAFLTFVEPIHAAVIERTARNAHIVIDNAYCAARESHAAPQRERMLKYRGHPGALGDAGGQLIGVEEQDDHYFIDTESDCLLVRVQAGGHTLRYRGAPSSDGSRPLLEAAIDPDCYELLCQTFGGSRAVIRKRREVWRVGTQTVNLDTAWSGAEWTPLGEFTVIHDPDGPFPAVAAGLAPEPRRYAAL